MEHGVYTGYMKNTKKHGPGTYRYDKGSIYDGEYINN